METYKYDFSVIAAVYNVEEFLNEAVESLINQTIGFDRIQLIMVDDGSTDKSGAICDEYGEKYPGNVIVIHKENGRQASARNVGIPYAEGQYVTFMDPDDTLTENTMELVKVFMDGEGLEADMCCIPMYFFGKRHGNHPLNSKFKEGTRMINMLEVTGPQYAILSSSSSFFRLETVRKMEFDTRLYHCEDAKAVIKVLINNPNLGLIREARYNYRKHGNSTVDGTKTHADSYLLHTKYFYRDVIDYAVERFGYIPGFVQNLIMYDMQWKLSQALLPEDLLTEEQEEEYKKELYSIASLMDDEIILQQTHLVRERKLFILGKKYNRSPKLRRIRAKKEALLPSKKGLNGNSNIGKTDIMLSFNGHDILSVSEMRTVNQFISIDESKKECTIEGQHLICGLDKYDVKPIVIADGTVYECETIHLDEYDGLCVGDTVSTRVGFKVTIPLKETTRVYSGLKVKDVPVINTKVFLGPFFPVSEKYANAYAFINGYVVTVEGHSLLISDKGGAFGRFVHECRFIKEIWKKNLMGGRKAILGRFIYYVVKPHLRNQIWIISDRIAKADDNGEALFRYLQEAKPEGVHPYFAISKESEDYSRILSIGSCVDSRSIKHKMLHLLCDVNISSGAEEVTLNPFLGHFEALRDILMLKKFVFLQHGITEKDGSGWLKKYCKNISGFVTAATRERESILNGKYYYGEDVVWLTGFPRYDRLYHAENKKITIMPTWRRNLVDRFDTTTGMWIGIDDFEKSEYYHFYDGLLNSEKLLDMLEEYGYTLQFFLHPNMRGYLDVFHHDKRVRFLSSETLYRDVYAESELAVTDYSSAIFDFSYLRKPIIYCQFDRDSFFSGDHTMGKGYFDYEEDGFGEVLFDLDSTIDKIIEYAKNGCTLKDQYRERVDSFFAFNDQNSCRRVTERILGLTRK